ncbi:hypothetical protein [Kitasatospora paranensis]|uniref:Uncharacterized protein n=1 Tax=Kitasatospora paranensis TaxID=258053 RepID=A0ABW2G554_9ACTN
MSERRNRRRLHARARALGVPVEQVPRRGTRDERPGRSLSAPSWDGPRWRDTETPDRDLPDLRDDLGHPGDVDHPGHLEDVRGRYDRRDREGFGPRPSRRAGCCEVVLTREVMDGGTIIMLSTHSAECPLWSSPL